MAYFPNGLFLYFVIYHKARRARNYAKNYVDPIGCMELQLLLEARSPWPFNTSIAPFRHRRITMKILYMLVVSFQHDCITDFIASHRPLAFHFIKW
jgi:hypothetical protein